MINDLFSTPATNMVDFCFQTEQIIDDNFDVLYTQDVIIKQVSDSYDIELYPLDASEQADFPDEEFEEEFEESS